MRHLGIVLTLFFISTVAGQKKNTTLSSVTLYNVFSTSAIIALPGCEYSGKQGTVKVKNATSDAIIKSLQITVPQCRLKRDVMTLPLSGNSQTVNVGFQITDLTPNAYYKAYYVFDTEEFNPTEPFSTRNSAASPSVTFARSGGMVVITVLLSIAMFLLIGALIFTLLAKGGAMKK